MKYIFVKGYIKWKKTSCRHIYSTWLVIIVWLPTTRQCFKNN